jgi:hypothetical protein
MALKYSKWPWSIPNGHKIYQHFLFKAHQKYYHIGFFGLNMYHLATQRHRPLGTTKKFIPDVFRSDFCANQLVLKHTSISKWQTKVHI